MIRRTREDDALALRLQQVRANDADHEAMMQDAAAAAGADLSAIRGMGPRDKDKALIAIFEDARK
jgi:hypothetical protein